MSEAEVKISSERIDDIPLIVEWLSRIEIAKYIDQKLKKPHGNHQGMSYGQLSVLLLTYIITQSDHRLCAVEAWVSPQQQVTSTLLQLQIEKIDSAIVEAETLAGWRLYVTNASAEHLTLTQSVMYYRDEWLLERGFHRFKRGSLPALPIYFQNQNRITGLMFLLNIALRVFTLMEFVVRQA
jgi:transposase